MVLFRHSESPAVGGTADQSLGPFLHSGFNYSRSELTLQNDSTQGASTYTNGERRACSQYRPEIAFLARGRLGMQV